MSQYDYSPRRRRWPLVLTILMALLAGLWIGGWYVAAGKVEELANAWKEREAKAGRVYTCASQTVGGFPFSIQVRCADAGADIKSIQTPLAFKAKDIVLMAQVWQPTTLTADFTGPMTIADLGKAPTVTATWKSARTQVHGIPAEPEHATIALEEPSISGSSGNPQLFKAKSVDIDGKMLSGSAANNPVIQVVVKAVAASSNTVHPVAATPFDADVTAVLRGLKDFAPKPLPVRFRELQANSGRIEIVNARVQQGDTIGVANGALSLSPSGRLDGQLRLTVANLEKILPALGLDKMLQQPQARGGQFDNAIGALDRLAPGLGGIARQNAAPMLAMGLAFIGQPTELEGKRAYAIPLRFQDGMVFLGPLQVGQTPPLF
ncbi:DUF2125 domain-containing protein [Leptospira sp. severe_002]|uniref:DUF2125 domain-containing protein n=1 Tax=Leptospira sp. severe_002 TaxID=2838237 RepID=UPI001E322749|nr:DUF2125 domain-containing protein [Leptospira sp. severe_002]